MKVVAGGGALIPGLLGRMGCSAEATTPKAVQQEGGSDERRSGQDRCQGGG